jgi:hypothetical protein
MANNDLYVTSALVNELSKSNNTPIPDAIIDPADLAIDEDYTPAFIRRLPPVATRHSMIWVRFQLEGIHKYPAALTDPQLADVQFLGYPHRHMFHFKVAIEVHHNDRDIEFIQFKRWLISLYGGSNEPTLQLDYKSCEMLADDLYEQIADRYPGRDVKIQISEDNENGCEITYGKAEQ